MVVDRVGELLKERKRARAVKVVIELSESSSLVLGGHVRDQIESVVVMSTCYS